MMAAIIQIDDIKIDGRFRRKLTHIATTPVGVVYRPALCRLDASVRVLAIKRVQSVDGRVIPGRAHLRIVLAAIRAVKTGPRLVIFRIAHHIESITQLRVQQRPVVARTVCRRQRVRHMPPQRRLVRVGAGDDRKDGVEAGTHAGIAVQRRRYRHFSAVRIRAGHIDDFAAVHARQAADFRRRIVNRFAVNDHRRHNTITAASGMFNILSGKTITTAHDKRRLRHRVSIGVFHRDLQL